MSKNKASTVAIEERLPLLEEILGRWKNEIGNDYPRYKNHVYRMVHFCFALHNCNNEERDKIIIAGCFHDLGIWANDTFDYLSPSIALAKAYLKQNNLARWIPEIALMIDTHHKIRQHHDDRYPLIEVFRKGDWVDVSLGMVKCGLPQSLYSKRQRPVSQRRFPQASGSARGGMVLEASIQSAAGFEMVMPNRRSQTKRQPRMNANRRE